jgi:2'-5' RNA ligase
VKTRRLFLALWPEDAVRSQLASALEAAPIPSESRRVPSTDWHVTLDFLGVVPEVARATIESHARDFRAVHEPLVLDRLQWWPESRVWVLSATRVPPALSAAQARLRDRLRASGLRVDARPWQPHVTIARAVDVDCSAIPAPIVAWTVRHVRLVESLPVVGSARYAQLWAHELT